MTLDGFSIVCQSERALAAEVAGEIAVVETNSGRYFGFDAIGSGIWQELEEPMRCDMLCARMSERFDGDDALIARETIAFVEKLVARGLVIVT